MTVATTFQPAYERISDGREGKPVAIWHVEGQAVGDASGGTLSATGFEDRRQHYTKLVFNVEIFSAWTNAGTVAARILDYLYRENTARSLQWFTTLVANPGGTLGGLNYIGGPILTRDCIRIPGPNNATGVYLGTIEIANVNGGTLNLSVGGYCWLKEELEHGHILRRALQ